MESRIAELEAKFSLAEDLLDELNRTIYRQQLQIDLLTQEVRALRQQLQNAAPNEAGETRDLRDDIPPHY